VRVREVWVLGGGCKTGIIVLSYVMIDMSVVLMAYEYGNSWTDQRGDGSGMMMLCDESTAVPKRRMILGQNDTYYIPFSRI